jgi:outer membrane murein-binding lipoprotein Lpp
MKTTKLLTIIVILQGLILAGQWLGAPSVVAPAHAQIPDAGGQRNEIIAEIRALNAKVEKLSAFLESGKLEVRVAAADENKAGRR